MNSKLIFMYIFFVANILLCCNAFPENEGLPKSKKYRSILVIPPLNHSYEVTAPYVFISTITKPLVEKGYYVFPVAVIDRLFKENGLPTPAEMNNISLEKINEHINPDAILYTEIEDWGQKYRIIKSVAKVKISLRLIDAKTGENIWSTRTTSRDESIGKDQDLDFTSLLALAIIEQVIGTIGDSTQNLSRKALNDAMKSKDLHDGPYKALH